MKIDSFKAENCKGDFPIAFFKNNYLIESDDIIYLIDYQGVIQEKYKLPTGLFYYQNKVDKNIISFYGWLDTDKKLDKYYFVRYTIKLDGVEPR